ncbi:MAG: hypothetical protein V3V62_12545, partial [bacterium]
GPKDLPPDCGEGFLRRLGLPGRHYAIRRAGALLMFLDSNHARDYEALARRNAGGGCAKRCDRVSCVRSDLRLSDEKQASWITKTLLHDKSRWRVVFLHHPLFSAGNRKGFGSKTGRLSAEGLQRKLFRRLRDGKVDIVIASGDPIYERSIQVLDANPDIGTTHFSGGAIGHLRVVFRKGVGPIFVVTGGAGAEPRKVANPFGIPLIDKLARADRPDYSQPWVGEAAVEPHLVYIRVEDDRLILSAWTPRGELVDRIEIREPAR